MFAFLLTVVILFSLHSKRDVDCERRERPRRELLRGLSSPTGKKEFVSLYGTKKKKGRGFSFYGGRTYQELSF